MASHDKTLFSPPLPVRVSSSWHSFSNCSNLASRHSTRARVCDCQPSNHDKPTSPIPFCFVCFLGLPVLGFFYRQLAIRYVFDPIRSKPHDLLSRGRLIRRRRPFRRRRLSLQKVRRVSAKFGPNTSLKHLPYEHSFDHSLACTHCERSSPIAFLLLTFACPQLEIIDFVQQLPSPKHTPSCAQFD